jgi:hypothetical protein
LDAAATLGVCDGTFGALGKRSRQSKDTTNTGTAEYARREDQMGRPITLPRRGETITIKEVDYCYGLGALRLRVSRVGAVVPMTGDPIWVEIEGIELDRHGTEREARRVLVRLAALAPQGSATTVTDRSRSTSATIPSRS